MEIKEINEILKSQEGYFNELQGVLRNIKKDSPSRKTRAYVSEKKARVTDIFTKASMNNKKLQQEEVMKEHNYNKNNFFQNICDEFTEIMQYLDTCKGQEEVVPENAEPGTASGKATGRIDSLRLSSQLARIQHIQRTLRQAKEALLEGKDRGYLQHVLTALQRQWQDAECQHFTLLSESSVQHHQYVQEHVFEELQFEVDNVIRELYSKSSVPSSQYSQCHGNRRVNLPKIELPVFNGKYESWNAFSDLFRKIIHEDDTLTSTEKMQYLKTYVKGDAAKLISHLTVSEAHYHTAWSLLSNRFNNERLVVTKHIDTILNAKKIDRPNAQNLRILHDLVNESLEAIKTHNIDISSWDPILTRIIATKWDSETNEKYEQQLADPHKLQTLADMMKFLEKRFMCYEATYNTRQDAGYTLSPLRAVASTMNVQSEEQDCWYCHKTNHAILTCRKFQALAPTDRIKAVFDNHKCKTCLTHENTTTCPNKKACYKCNKQGHHSLLHVSDGRPEQNQSREGSPIPSTSKQYTQIRSNLVTTLDADVTLLATALVQIKAADGTQHVFRALCDQGSEASFCTEQVARLLAYPRQKVQARISGLADEKPKTVKFSVSVEIQPTVKSEYSIRVDMMIMSRLTGAVPLKDIPRINTANIKRERLADPMYYKSAPIDIILGVREFSKILTTKCIKLRCGTIAQETKFGWVLSGICKSNTKTIQVNSLTTRATEPQQLCKRWKHVQKVNEVGVKKYTKDCLHQIQQNYACRNNQENIKRGAVVLMKEDNIGPSRWPIAKIIDVHEGNDNLTRVVTLQKSSGSIMKRSIHRLIPLPINKTENDKQTPQTVRVNSTTIRTEPKDENNQNHDNLRRNTAKCKMSWWFLLLLLLQLIGYGITTYTIKAVPPGFYVEKIGTARISRGVFRIETNYQRIHLEDNYAKVKKACIQFRNLCSQIETAAQETHCKQFEHHLNEQASKVEKTKEFLTEVNRTRKKRGLLGQFMTSIFGVNDEAYRDIESLNKNQGKLLVVHRLGNFICFPGVVKNMQ